MRLPVAATATTVKVRVPRVDPSKQAGSWPAQFGVAQVWVGDQCLVTTGPVSIEMERDGAMVVIARLLIGDIELVDDDG